MEDNQLYNLNLKKKNYRIRTFSSWQYRRNNQWLQYFNLFCPVLQTTPQNQLGKLLALEHHHRAALVLGGQLEFGAELPEELPEDGGLDGPPQLVQEEPVAQVTALLDARHAVSPCHAAAVLKKTPSIKMLFPNILFIKILFHNILFIKMLFPNSYIVHKNVISQHIVH